MKSFGPFVLTFLALAVVPAAATASPVERVVTLLNDMKEKLVLDEKTEQQIYDKYACWCEKTSARKADSITDAQNELRMVGQTILKLKGTIATRTAEITQLEALIKQNLKEQKEATAIREKENAAWAAEAAETKDALAASQKAIEVIVEGAGAALLQGQEKATSAVKAALELVPTKLDLKPDNMALLSEFLGSAGSSSYAPQSATVQGILKDMYDTFSTNLETATNTEAIQNREFEGLIAAKTEELNEAKETKQKKEEEKAEAELQLADAQQIYDDTMEQKKADIVFFDETREACEAKHEAWTTRSSLRTEEIAGVEKALEILTSDAARELFASAIKPGKEVGAKDSYDTGMDIAPSFLQLRGDTSAPKMKAYTAIRDAVRKTHSLRLAAIAVQVRSSKVGHFEKVVMAIDSMVKTLKDEDAADIAKRDQCKREYQSIESTIKDVVWKIEKNGAKIAKLTKIIEKRNKQLQKTEEEIEDVTKQMEDMTDQRKAENADFLAAKKEDQDAIDLLMQARSALMAYYNKNKIGMGPIQGSVKGVFVQQGPEFAVSADQAPEAEFSSSGKRKNESKGIVQIMTMLIEDTNDEIKNGMKNEETAQLEYEKQMAAAKKLKEELIAKKTALEGAISQRTEERGAEQVDKKENEDDLSDEEAYKAEIEPDCDWIIGAFTKRAEARAAELKGLTGARDFLAGAVPASLVQSAPAFDDHALSKVSFLGMK